MLLRSNENISDKGTRHIRPQMMNRMIIVKKIRYFKGLSRGFAFPHEDPPVDPHEEDSRRKKHGWEA